VYKVRTHWMQEWDMLLPLGQCWCCHRTAEIQRAHLQAAAIGGSSEPSNLMLTCRVCNIWLDRAVSECGLEAAIGWVRRCQETSDALAPPSAELRRLFSDEAQRHGFPEPTEAEVDQLWAMRMGSGVSLFGRYA